MPATITRPLLRRINRSARKELLLPRLREFRRLRLLTQSQLAERAGVNRNTVGKIESGEAAPHNGTVRKLADALEVEPADLMRFPHPSAR